MKQLFCFIIILITSTFSLHAQNRFQKVCDTIPYTIRHEKIIIPVQINDTTVNFILDTGGQTGMMYGEAVKLNLKATGASRPVGDYSGKGLSYSEGVIENITYGKNYKLKSLKALIFPNTGFFKELNVVGILGGDAFAQTVLTIDSKNEIIVINYPYRPDGLKVEDGAEMKSGNTFHSIVDVKMGSVTLPFLFDTGAQGFLLLSAEDYANSSGKIKSSIVDHGFGIEGVGIGGLGKPIELHKIAVEELDFFGKKFHNVETITSKRGQSIIGRDMMNYGKIVIDYIRNRFYFIPYSTDIEPDTKLPAKWNISILPNDTGFFVSTVWDEMKEKVEFGETVTNINGVDLSNVKKSQLVIDEIMEQIKDNRATITVTDKNNKTRKITITRK